MQRRIYLGSFPECPFSGPVDLVPFSHLGSDGAIPRKCTICEFLFEGECLRAIEQNGGYLPLDYGPCPFRKETGPVISENKDDLISEVFELPDECAKCRFLGPEYLLNGVRHFYCNFVETNSGAYSHTFYSEERSAISLNEEWDEHIEDSNAMRANCMEIVHLIKNKAATFTKGKGMVVVIVEGCRVQIHFFDGVSRTYWGYINRHFVTDATGETFLLRPPTVVTLLNSTETRLLDVLTEEFAHCVTHRVMLYGLDPTSWEHEPLYIVGSSFGVRISFDQPSDV